MKATPRERGWSDGEFWMVSPIDGAPLFIAPLIHDGAVPLNHRIRQNQTVCSMNRSALQPMMRMIFYARPPRPWRLLLLTLLIPAAFLLTGFGPPRLTDRDQAPTRRLSTGQLRVWALSQEPPDVSAPALLLHDVDAGRTLYARAPDEPRPMASLTKLMTALLVLESGDLDARVTIQPDDLVGGASMGLAAGETLTVEELLWGLLIPSGNDAAMALARHVGGSVDAFVDMMNARAAEMGLTATAFKNPHGFDAEGHASSPADLLALTQADLAYPLFREIVATAETTVAGHPLRNTNQLLGLYPGANGVKTGTTPLAGQCLVASIERGGHQVLAIVLGSGDRYEDVRRLYSHYQANYAWLDGDPRRLAVLNRLYDANGHLWYLAATGDPPAVLVPRWEYPTLQAYRRIQRPPAGTAWQPGLTVGVLEWRLGDQIVGSQPLVLR